MIKFEKYTLKNGMKVIINRDQNTDLVAFNMLYNVGSKHENPNKTGLAHFFEHLMFSGTHNIPDFDYYTQKAGGENNAFTSVDITDFYTTLPAQNIETAFWLEADRMNNLKLDAPSIENEKRVVIEEFKETTLNVPYGSMWHLLMDLSYDQHPYRWTTIGKEIKHIEDFTKKDILDFYTKYYNPGNAILTISGNVDIDVTIKMAEKWFGSIESYNLKPYKRFVEPKKTKISEKQVKEKLPSNAVYFAYHIGGRKDDIYYCHDIISDILGRGRSSRLYQNLLKEKEIFSDIQAYVNGYFDTGLLIIGGKISDKVSVEKAISEIKLELQKMKTNPVGERELQKQKNKIKNQNAFSQMSIMNKAINLGQYELLKDANLINQQDKLYSEVTAQNILEESNKIFSEENCSRLVYIKEDK